MECQEIIECDSWITSIALSPDEICIGCENGDIFAHSLQDFNKVREIKGHFDRISKLEFTKETLISSSLDGTMRKWTDSSILKSLLSPSEEAELEELLS